MHWEEGMALTSHATDGQTNCSLGQQSSHTWLSKKINPKLEYMEITGPIQIPQRDIPSINKWEHETLSQI